MDSFQFVKSMVPDDGWYFLWAINKNDKIPKSKCYDSIDTAVQAAHQFDANGYDAYFALSSFETDKGGRKQSNVLHTKALFLDLDVGQDKVEKRKGYASKLEAATALHDFCQKNKLPAPTMVDSGRGIHVYWALTEAIPPSQWKPVAERLKALCAQDGLLCDPAVPADSARVLRVPMTHNHKTDPPKEVKVHDDTITFHDFDEFAALLGDPIPVPAIYLPKTQMQELMEHDSALTGFDPNYVNSFKMIVDKTQAGTGCGQIEYLLRNPIGLEEPMWRAGLSIIKFCEDGDTIAHGFSRQDADQYDERETCKKLEGIAGPHTCATFNSLNPNICESCPNWGKIKSPIVLGREFKEALPAPEPTTGWDAEPTSKDVLVDTRPPCPFPFKWGKNNPGIYMDAEDKDGETKQITIYDHNFYIEARFFDKGGEGECAAFVLELPHDGDRRFTAPIKDLQTEAGMRKVLASHGVVALGSNWKHLEGYVTKSLVNLQLTKKATSANKQMGFTEDKKGFIVGDKVYRKGKSKPDRNYEVASTKDLFKPLTPKGNIDEWKYTVNCYNHKGFELRQLMVCLGFGSPLMEMIDNAATCGFHVYCKDSGVGKTSAMNTSLTAWGDPENLRLKEGDTHLSRARRLAVGNNLPNLLDEFTNTSPENLSKIILEISEGHEKKRLTQSAEAKSDIGSWSMLFATTANTSILERIALGKHNPNAEAQRVMECVFEEMALHESVDEDRFNAGMTHHYGHAGPIFIQHVLDNYDAVKDRLFAKRKYLREKYGMSSKNRYWSAALACILLAGEIAKELGLLEYDMAILEQYVSAVIKENQLNIENQEYSVEELLSTYISEFHNGILTVMGAQKTAKSLSQFSESAQKLYGPIIGRYESENKMLAIDFGHFSHWLANNQAGAKETIKKMRTDMNAAIIPKYNFTKGITAIPLMRKKALIIKDYMLEDDEENIH